MITIHIDFIDGTEVSYIEGLELQDNFTTNCLTFFSQELTNAENVQVIDKHGRSIDRNELMSNTGGRINSIYTDKEMRPAHNIYKMLVANSFTWKQPVKVVNELDVENYLITHFVPFQTTDKLLCEKIVVKILDGIDAILLKGIKLYNATHMDITHPYTSSLGVIRRSLSNTAIKQSLKAKLPEWKTIIVIANAVYRVTINNSTKDK